MTRATGTAKPTVVVVGGGYGGIAVAKALDETQRRRARRAEGRLHAQHRRSAGAGGSILASEDLPPVRRALDQWPSGSGPCLAVDPHRVVTASGEEISADYVVLATGSRYPFPAKTDLVDTHHAQEQVRRAHEALTQGGSGPLGRRGPGRHRARRRDPSRVAGQVDRPARRRRRDSRRSVQARAQSRTPTPTARDPSRADPGQPAASGTADRARRAGNVHRDHRGRNRNHGRHLVPLLRRRTQQRLPRETSWHPLAAPTGSSRSVPPSRSPARQPSSPSGTSRPPTPRWPASPAPSRHRGGQHQLSHPGKIRPRPLRVHGCRHRVPIGPTGGAGQFPGQDEIVGSEIIAEARAGT